MKSVMKTVMKTWQAPPPLRMSPVRRASEEVVEAEEVGSCLLLACLLLAVVRWRLLGAH
jgi:hypothetical protein